jgi:hypothetical protein
LGLTGTAFGYVLRAHTGVFGPAGTESDNSEWVRMDAPDFPAALNRLVPRHLPLPAGWTWQPKTEEFIAAGRREPILKQVSGIKGEYAMYAQCAWTVEWLTARRSHDEERALAAVDVLRQVPTWPEIAAIDGGGLRESFGQRAEAAARGDEAYVREWAQGCLAHFPVTSR